MSGQNVDEIIGQELVEVDTKTVVKVPRKYKVVLINDDYTPMDFVVEVLKHFFYLNEDIAAQVMLQVHIQGRGVCGVFTKDIAETKAALVNEFSRLNQHPLLSTVEPE